MSAWKAAKDAGKAVPNGCRKDARQHVPHGSSGNAGSAGSGAAPAEDGSVRLNKAIAHSGVCSRRKADELIAQGRVKVNGVPAFEGQRVLASDQVTIDGQPLAASQELVYLMLNKPVQVVSTASDPENRQTVLDFVPPKYRNLRLYPVGRLDFFSEGLILLTNDGPLAHRLMHPSHNQRKTYEVLVRGTAPEAALETMRRGMVLAEGDRTAPADIVAGATPRGNTVLTFTLRQGLNRQIRRMCRDVGLTILKLRRIAEGPLVLGQLGSGEVRELTASEIARLKQGE